MRRFFKNVFFNKKGKLDKIFIIILLLIIELPFMFSINRNVGISNYPTIKEGEYSVILKHFYNIKVNDFIVFEIDDEGPISKRVVAMEGDHVVIRDGKLYINDIEDSFDENVIYLGTMDLVVPENSYFVMGDNRMNSTDSRIFGCINDDDIIGKVLFR